MSTRDLRSRARQAAIPSALRFVLVAIGMTSLGALLSVEIATVLSKPRLNLIPRLFESETMVISNHNSTITISNG
jgi:hypothetical protein